MLVRTGPVVDVTVHYHVLKIRSSVLDKIMDFAFMHLRAHCMSALVALYIAASVAAAVAVVVVVVAAVAVGIVVVDVIVVVVVAVVRSCYCYCFPDYPLLFLILLRTCSCLQRAVLVTSREQEKTPDDESTPLMIAQTRTAFANETQKPTKSKHVQDVSEQGGAGIGKVLKSTRDPSIKTEAAVIKRLVDGTTKDSKDKKDVQFLLR